MAFQSVPNTAEVVLQYVQNARPCSMTFYGYKGSGYDLEDLTTLAETMDDWAAENFIPELSSQSAYSGVNVRGLESLNDYEVFAATGAGAGTLAQNPAPNLNAVVIARLSGLTGRSARGRVYWPMAASWFAANEDFVLTTVLEGLTEELNGIKVAMAGAGFIECIVSRVANGVQRAEGVIFVITEYAVRTTKVGKMSRRRPGGS